MRIGKKYIEEGYIAIKGVDFALTSTASEFIRIKGITHISLCPKNRYEWKSVYAHTCTASTIYYRYGDNQFSLCTDGLKEVFGCVPAIIYFK